jgi:hypothetical protein
MADKAVGLRAGRYLRISALQMQPGAVDEVAMMDWFEGT